MNSRRLAFYAVFCSLGITVTAQEFRKVGDKAISILSTDWTFMTDNIKVFHIEGTVLVCAPYTITTVQGQANVPVGAGKHRIEATFRTTTNWNLPKAFALKNFPKQVTAEIGSNITPPPIKAMRVGSFTWHDEHNYPHLVQLYDYGIPVAPTVRPVTAAEVEAGKNEATKKKAQTGAALVAHFQKLADEGDPRGQFELGKRYLKGDGVEQDEPKGLELLRQSAAKGNTDATAELAKIAKKSGTSSP